jgi:hypothetical protein
MLIGPEPIDPAILEAARKAANLRFRSRPHSLDKPTNAVNDPLREG